MDLWLWPAALCLAAIAAWRAVRRRDRDRELMLLCHRAGLEYSPVDPFPDTMWLPFAWLVEGRWVRAEHVAWSRADGEDARAFDLVVEERRADDGSPPATHVVTCATVALPFGCSRLEIRPREGAGAAWGLASADEVRLELEAFDRRFRLHADDRRFAMAFCDQRMMRALMQLPAGVTVAVNEDRMLLRARALAPAEVLLLFEAARAIGRSVPRVVAELYPPRPTKGRHEDRWLQGRWSPEPTGDDVASDPVGATAVDRRERGR